MAHQARCFRMLCLELRPCSSGESSMQRRPCALCPRPQKIHTYLSHFAAAHRVLGSQPHAVRANVVEFASDMHTEWHIMTHHDTRSAPHAHNGTMQRSAMHCGRNSILLLPPQLDVTVSPWHSGRLEALTLRAGATSQVSAAGLKQQLGDTANLSARSSCSSHMNGSSRGTGEDEAL